MNSTISKKGLITALMLAAVGYAGHALAHTAAATLDPGGNNPNATDLVQVTCYDDGDGPTDHLYVQIQDNSPPVPGLFVSVQIFKDGKMANTTDTSPGDASASNPISVGTGNGLYWLSVSKTNVAGPRNFSVTYHCQTSNDVHTGTCGPGEGCGILQVQ